MRLSTLRVAVALFTLTAGISAARVWDSLAGGRPAPQTTAVVAQPEQMSASAGISGRQRDEQEILEIIRQYDLAQTRHDAAFFERVEADNFTLYDEDGRVHNRSEAIALMKTWDKSIKYTSDDLDVRFYGDAAIVTGRMTATYTRAGGQYSWRWIDLFVKRNGDWKILSTTQVN